MSRDNFFFIFQLSQHSPSFTRHPLAFIETTNLMSEKFFLSCARPRGETGSQLYQKRQLRKLANFSNPIQSTKNTQNSSLDKQFKRKWKLGTITSYSLASFVTGILLEKIFCLNINQIWKVDCHLVMLFSRIWIERFMGKTIKGSLKNRNWKIPWIFKGFPPFCLIFSLHIISFFSSCVMDLYQFLFTSIDLEIRSRFMADFVCSVYYDSFVKTLMSINSSLEVFSKSDFIREFNDKIFCGFLFAAELHTWMVREAEWRCPDRHSRSVKY